jgi:hypothetical protein
MLSKVSKDKNCKGECTGSCDFLNNEGVIRVCA